MTTAPIAIGWGARIGYNAEPPPAGMRLMSWSQSAALSEPMVTYGGDNDALAVAHVKWLMGGRSSGVVWVSDVTSDLSYWGAGTVVEVGATARATLAAAGFTMSAHSDTTEQFTFATSGYDVLIVGDDACWGSGLSASQKAAQLRTWVSDGGGLIHLRTEAGSHDFNTSPFWISDSSTVLNPGGEGTPTMDEATAGSAVLFPDGLTFHKKSPHYNGIANYPSNGGPYRQRYGWDGSIDPYWRFTCYSAYGDCGEGHQVP